MIIPQLRLDTLIPLEYSDIIHSRDWITPTLQPSLRTLFSWNCFEVLDPSTRTEVYIG